MDMLRFALLTCAALLAVAAPAKPAAPPQSFQVGPMSIERPAEPGVPQTGVITITNTTRATPGTDAPLHLRAYPVDWTLNRAGTPQFAPAGSLAESCSKWITISPIEFDVSAGQSTQVRYTFTVPAGATGCWRTMIMFQMVPPPDPTKRQALAVSGRIGSAIYVEVGPQVKRLRITQFQATPKNVSLTVQDTGNSHVRLKGVLQFADSTGAIAKQVDLPGALVLDGVDNQRDFTFDTPSLPSGTYTVTTLIDYGADALLGARTHVIVP